MKRIFWIAGENSADFHASGVIAELNKRNKDFEHFGIGGLKMKAEKFRPIFPFERFCVMGFIEVVKHISFFIEVESTIKTIFQSNPPDLVILVDYPGLNMRIAKLAKKNKIPVLYYISPQFWAWKYNRIFKLKEFTDHVAYILPFEQKFFDKEDVTSSYVGHPISEEIKIEMTKKEFTEKNNLDPDKKWLGFLPGSRNIEIKKLLPEFLKAISYFNDKNYEFLISKAATVSNVIFGKITANSQNIRIIEDNSYEMMKYCDFLVVTSGTATIETAYLGTPFIIVYKTSKISYEIGKKFIKIKRIGLPNIVLDKDIVPELIQDEVNGKHIYEKIDEIISSKEKYQRIFSELKELHNILGSKSASREVADIIENFFQ